MAERYVLSKVESFKFLHRLSCFVVLFFRFQQNIYSCMWYTVKNPIQSIWTADCTQFLSPPRSRLLVETLVFSRGGEGRAWLAQCWEHSPPTKGAMDQFWTQCHIWFEFIGSLHWIVFHCILWFPTSHHKTDVFFYLIKQSLETCRKIGLLSLASSP